MRLLRKVYEYWMAFGHAIGVVMTPLQLLLIYVLVFGPSRLVTKLLGLDPLDRRMTAPASFWTSKSASQQTIDQARHQF